MKQLIPNLRSKQYGSWILKNSIIFWLFLECAWILHMQIGKREKLLQHIRNDFSFVINTIILTYEY